MLDSGILGQSHLRFSTLLAFVAVRQIPAADTFSAFMFSDQLQLQQLGIYLLQNLLETWQRYWDRPAMVSTQDANSVQEGLDMRLPCFHSRFLKVPVWLLQTHELLRNSEKIAGSFWVSQMRRSAKRSRG